MRFRSLAALLFSSAVPPPCCAALVWRVQVRISRRRLLDSAFKVFELYAGSKSQLEIEFFGEVGSGTCGASLLLLLLLRSD